MSMRFPSSQDGSYPRHQFLDVERLGDVVVRTGLEPDHDIACLPTCREHYERNLTRLPDPPADLETPERRQHQIENDDVEGLFSETHQSDAPVTRRHDLKSGILQTSSRYVADALIVFHQ